MTTGEAISSAILNAEKKRKELLQKTSGISVSGILRVYREMFYECYGEKPIIITKEVENFIHGFVSTSKRNEIEGRIIYAYIRNCVKYWDSLLSYSRKAVTNKGKEIILLQRPDIRSIVVCSNYFMDLLKTMGLR